MSNRLLQLKSKHATIISEATEILNRNGHKSQEYLDKLNEADSTAQHIRGLEQLEELDPQPATKVEDRSAPLENADQRRSKLNATWRSYLKGPRYFNPDDTEIRDILSSTSNGAALIPIEFQSTFISEALKYFAPLTQYVRTRLSPNGRAVQVGHVDDRNNGLLYIPEAGGSTVVPEADPSSFSSAFVSTSTLSTGVVKYSVQLLDDSGFDLGELLKRLFSTRIGRGTEKLLTRGTDSAGTATPNNPGLISIASTGTTTASLAAGIGWDEIINLFEALDPAFLPRAVFQMTSNTRNALLKTLDSTGRSLLVPAPTADGVDMLLGKPVIVNQALDQLGTASGCPVIFGSLYDGVEMISSELRVQNLTERFVDQLLNGMIGTIRIGSEGLAPGALQKLVLAAS